MTRFLSADKTVLLPSIHIPAPPPRPTARNQIVVSSCSGALQAYDIGQVVLCLASLFPGCFSKRYPNDVRINAQIAEMQGNFPIYENTMGVFPYASLLSVDEVNETRYAVIGVTNRMLATHPSLAHVTVDLGNAGQLHVKYGASNDK